MAARWRHRSHVPSWTPTFTLTILHRGWDMSYSPRQLGDLTPTNPNRQGLLAVFHIDLPPLVGLLLCAGSG